MIENMRKLLNEQTPEMVLGMYMGASLVFAVVYKVLLAVMLNRRRIREEFEERERVSMIRRASIRLKEGFNPGQISPDMLPVAPLETKLVQAGAELMNIVMCGGKPIGYLPVDGFSPLPKSPVKRTRNFTNESYISSSPLRQVTERVKRNQVEFLTESGVIIGFGARIMWNGENYLVTATHVSDAAMYARRFAGENIYHLNDPLHSYNDVTIFSLTERDSADYGFCKLTVGRVRSGHVSVVSRIVGPTGKSIMAEASGPVTRSCEMGLFDICHEASTYKGTSGAPVVYKSKVVAIHRGSFEERNINVAVALVPVLEIMLGKEIFEEETVRNETDDLFHEVDPEEFEETYRFKSRKGKGKAKFDATGDFGIAMDPTTGFYAVSNDVRRWADYDTDEEYPAPIENFYTEERADFRTTPTSRVVNLSVISPHQFGVERSFIRKLTPPTPQPLLAPLTVNPPTGELKREPPSKKKSRMISLKRRVSFSPESLTPTDSGLASPTPLDKKRPAEPPAKVLLEKLYKKPLSGRRYSQIHTLMMNLDTYSLSQLKTLNHHLRQGFPTEQSIQAILNSSPKGKQKL